jgi:ElaB/YqjD/DUF883 family membrane-anchored ribosome-binding protein
VAEIELTKELEKLRSDLVQLRTDVAELAKAVKSVGVDKAESVKATVAEEVRHRREALRARIDEARARGRTAVEDLEDEIQQHPYGSLLTAFGAGFIIAKLLQHGDRH